MSIQRAKGGASRQLRINRWNNWQDTWTLSVDNRCRGDDLFSRQCHRIGCGEYRQGRSHYLPHPQKYLLEGPSVFDILDLHRYKSNWRIFATEFAWYREYRSLRRPSIRTSLILTGSRLSIGRPAYRDFTGRPGRTRNFYVTRLAPKFITIA